jgi:hypothetical protein
MKSCRRSCKKAAAGPPAPNETVGLTKVLLGEDPSAIIETLKGALRRGVPPVEVSLAAHQD